MKNKQSAGGGAWGNYLGSEAEELVYHACRELWFRKVIWHDKNSQMDRSGVDITVVPYEGDPVYLQVKVSSGRGMRTKEFQGSRIHKVAVGRKSFSQLKQQVSLLVGDRSHNESLDEVVEAIQS